MRTQARSTFLGALGRDGYATRCEYATQRRRGANLAGIDTIGAGGASQAIADAALAVDQVGGFDRGELATHAMHELAHVFTIGVST